MINSENSSIDELLTIDTIKNNILPKYSIYNADINIVKIKDTTKQRAVFKINYNNNYYCIKKVYYDEANLLFVYSAMEWLYRNDIKVPKLLPANNGNRFVIYNNMLFILTYWVEGDKCDFDNINHLYLSSKTLGKIHKTSKNFTPIFGSVKRQSLDDYHLTLTKHLNSILKCANLANNYQDKFSKIFVKNLDYNLELAKLALSFTSSMDKDDLSTSLCHGDYVNKNIIINKDCIWIIDFDKCSYDYCSHDIAYFLRRLLKRPSSNWSTYLTLKVIDSYLENNSLTESDFKYILAYIAFPQKFWKISRDYYNNIKKCNPISFCTLLEKGLERSETQLDFIYRLVRILKDKYSINIL